MKPIRSFVRRSGRMTPAQQYALDQHQTDYQIPNCLEASVDKDNPLDFDALFQRQVPRHLEIGFGMGEVLLTLAVQHPDVDYLGIEVYQPGVGRVLAETHKQALTNIRIWSEDAVQILTDCIAPASLDMIRIFFPDPWHKTRHHKRRIIQPDFVDLLAASLKPQGMLHLATDWTPYAKHMLAVLDDHADFNNQVGVGNYAPRPDSRPFTKFEKRGQRLGHQIHDLLYTKN